MVNFVRFVHFLHMSAMDSSRLVRESASENYREVTGPSICETEELMATSSTWSPAYLKRHHICTGNFIKIGWRFDASHLHESAIGLSILIRVALVAFVTPITVPVLGLWSLAQICLVYRGPVLVINRYLKR